MPETPVTPPAAVKPPEAPKPAPAFDPEEALKAELAKLPSIDELERQKVELANKLNELDRLQDLKANFGPGKSGKKKFNLLPLPKGLDKVSINGEVMEGIKELTWAQYMNWISIRDGRLSHEKKSRYGEGAVAEHEILAAAGLSGAVGVHVSPTGVAVKF